ncbi:MAG: FtsX-like permease family protein [Hyphomicrobiales bacterium]|nr:FtsX-like permease family protein [Hyphomicrobiales bacterium]
MIIARLAWSSLINRRVTSLLTIFAIALSIILLLGVEKVRVGSKAGFLNTISGTDLIVGARSGQIQLLLYSVFRMGNATNNISMETLNDIKKRPEVKWIVPISLGDSHRGYRVMGSTVTYFDHYRYRRNTKLEFDAGKPFDDLFEAVIGAEVAAKLGYTIGSEIVVAHGAGRVALGAKHKDKPFIVAGILAPSGTPVDRTVHVSLRAIEAIHVGWEGGTSPRGKQARSESEVREMKLEPRVVTAAYVGLKSKIGIFSLQGFINNYKEEPVTAILPGVAFAQLWSLVGSAETALIAISMMVVFTAFLGMIISILGSLNERRREMAILRAIGARPLQVFILFVAEAAVLALVGILLGMGLLYLIIFITWPMIEQASGLYLELSWPRSQEIVYILIIMAGGIVAGAIPAIRAYKMSLSDGLTIKT